MPSKLPAESFISFIEARSSEDLQPNPYAYLKVVGRYGLRNVGLNSVLMPNRSIYLGENLVIRIKEDETSLDLYDLYERQQSSTSISILSNPLIYDFTPLGAETDGPQ